jgi:hypothetical protein
MRSSRKNHLLQKVARASKVRQINSLGLTAVLERNDDSSHFAMLPSLLSVQNRPRFDLALCSFASATLVIAAAAFLYFAFVSPTFYLFTDAFYYDAVAAALHDTGRLFDPAIVPPRPIYTPQNGIVLIDAALRSITPTSRQTAIAVLGMLASCACFLSLYRICRALDLSERAAQLATTAFVCSPLLLRVAAAPLNDIFFMALFLTGLGAQASARPAKRIGVMTTLALVMGIFRLQGIVLFCAAALASWRSNRREAILYGVLTIVNGLVPFFLSSALSDNSARAHQVAAEILSFHLFSENIWYMLSSALPKLLTAAGPGLEHLRTLFFPVSAAIYLLVAKRSWDFLVQNRRFDAIVALATLGTILLVIITPYYDPRYYLCVYAFILILPFQAPWASPRLRMAILVSACATNLFGLGARLLFAETDFSHNAAAASTMRQAAPARYQLISEDPDIAYFVLERSSIAGLPRLDSHTGVILFGSAPWRETQAARLVPAHRVSESDFPPVVVRFNPQPIAYSMTLLRPTR